MKTEPRLFFYKLTTDNGGAPCAYRGLLSLAICKPRIRKKACEGDWIFGFGSKKMGERLIYLAQVRNKLSWKRYSIDHQGRPDCIYSWNRPNFKWKIGKKYHNPKETGDQRRKDVGNDAKVLLCTTFRYLGKNSMQIPQNLRLLKSAVKRLGQNHRVNHLIGLERQLLEMRRLVFCRYKKKISGRPTHWQGCHLPCN